MARQYFDDGSWLDYDAAGNVLGGADVRGAPISASGTGVVQQVLDLLSLGYRTRLASQYPQGYGTATQTVPAYSFQSQLPGLLLLAFGGLIAFKLLAK